MQARLVEIGSRGLRERRLGGDRAGEILLTRFLRNPSVTCGDGANRRRGYVRALCGAACSGDSGYHGGTLRRRWRLYLHAVLAVDADDGAILGLIYGEFLSRNEGRKAERRHLPIEQKESYRWLHAAQQAGQVCATARRITMVSDRESDIFRHAFATSSSAQIFQHDGGN